MNVLNVYVTEGTSNGKHWESRSAVCIDSFKSKDGDGEFIKVFKLTRDCIIPLPDDDVRPLFNERGKVVEWVTNG